MASMTLLNGSGSFTAVFIPARELTPLRFHRELGNLVEMGSDASE